MKYAITFAAALAVALPAAAPAQERPRAAEGQTVNNPEAFAQMAASSNQFEIQSSQLALEHSQSSEVRAFAEQMVADHTAAGERMMAAAKEEGVEVPAELLPEDGQQLQALSQAQDFDTAYVEAQVMAHDKAVALFQGFAEGGADGPLQDFAQETLPVLEQHRTHIHHLAGG